MSTATSGRAREYRVRDRMIDAGYLFIMRAAGSKGPADLALVHPFHGLAFVQVGTKTKTLGPADRDRLCSVAEATGAMAILAQVIEQRGKPTEYLFWQVTREPASKWQPWPL